jgi:NHL repeat
MSRGTKTAVATLCCLAWSLLLTTAASADATFCLPGSGNGKCNGPHGLSVDFETGHLYVADRGNNRVNVFEPDGTSGTPVSFGEGELTDPAWVAVDNDSTSASQHSVYATNAGVGFLVKKFKPTGEYVAADSFGEAGTGPCQFKPNDPIAVGPGGDVYVANSYDKDGAGPLRDFLNRVIVFDSEGNCLDEEVLFEANLQSVDHFAVDSSGSCYVTVAGVLGGVLRKYDCSTGTLLYELDPGTETKGLAVDSSDNLFAKQRGELATSPAIVHMFTKYSPTGATLIRFGYLLSTNFPVPSLAAYSSAEGDLFTSQGSAGIKYLTLPPPGPVIFPQPCKVKTGELGSVRAVLQGEVNPEGKPTNVRFEYLTQAQFEAGGFSNPAKQTTASVPLPGAADFNLHEAAVEAENLQPETVYHCRLIASNADAPAGIAGEPGTFKTDEGFKFGPAWVSNVGAEVATVNVEGNPLGLAAKGQIEYVEDAKYRISGFAEALRAPAGEIDFGASEEMQRRSVVLTGLTPGTVYRYRLRVKNGTPPAGIVCPEQKPECPDFEHRLKTYPLHPGEFDLRRNEMVSPPQKNSAEVAVPGAAGGLFEDRTVRIQAGAGSGEAVTYTSWTSFGEASSAPSTSQYLSRRTATGWATENISPFGLQALAQVPPYSGFSDDLRFGAMRVRQPALTPDCPDGFENLYLRDATSGALRCLTPEAPEIVNGITGFCMTFAGASRDGSRAFFTSVALYPSTGAPKGDGSGLGFQLYEWSADQGLALVSVLPGGAPASPTKDTSFGAGGLNCQVGQKSLRHVVSADGRRAFWTYVPSDPTQASQLLARVDRSETVQLDAVQSGGGKPGNGVFWAASADGSVVYFTDENRLISGSKSEAGKPDLYRYEFGQAKPLTNLTKALEPMDVEGVLGVSNDGSYVYFVARGILTEEENGAQQKAQAGKNNLYLHHNGETRFIATLAEDDLRNWESQPKSLSSRVSPDGTHLAFLSVEAQALAGYDNTVAVGEHCRSELVGEEFVGGPLCQQAFVYDAEADSLTCASCNPSGARPLGPTLFPGWSNVYEGPRFLSDDGSRLFFETFDALTLADASPKRDVYEFELPGSGSCSTDHPSFDPASGGCHFLVTSGRGGDESFLIDASATGRDVFFSTRDALVGWDVDSNYDVYDSREGGGFPEPSPVPPGCTGEACLPAPPAQPAPPASGTADFVGPGNPTSKPKKKKRKRAAHKRKKGKGQKAKGRKKRGKGRKGRRHGRGKARSGARR